MKKIFTSAIFVLMSAAPTAAEDQIRLSVYFNKDGSVSRPLNHRQWVNVGAFMLPKGAVNIIDLEPIKTAELLVTYVEPQSYAIYMATGFWPEGAQFVKEFTALNEPEEDGSVSQSYYTGLSYIIKDSSRFPVETAHLGFFQFGHQPEPYKQRASLMPRNRCSACHEAKASHQQNIFADRHIGLDSTLLRPKKTE